MTDKMQKLLDEITAALAEMEAETVNELCHACGKYDGQMWDYCWYNLGYDFVQALYNGDAQAALADLFDSSVNMADSYIRLEGGGTLVSTPELEFDSWELEEIARAVVCYHKDIELPAELAAIISHADADALEALVADYTEGWEVR